jgi:hypothetical protein
MSGFGDRFYDFVISSADPLWHVAGAVDSMIKSFEELAGNGTSLIVGYKKPTDDALHNEFRMKLDRCFDLKMSKQAIYETPQGEILIVHAKRRCGLDLSLHFR